MAGSCRISVSAFIFCSWGVDPFSAVKTLRLDMLLSMVRLGRLWPVPSEANLLHPVTPVSVGAHLSFQNSFSHYVCFAMYKQNTEDCEIASQPRLTENKPPAKANKRKKHVASSLRKAPQAPKRFKSSYICFFTAKRDEVKAEIGGTPTVCSENRITILTLSFRQTLPFCSCS